tara:strand:+ start:3316 stop:3978 length:663 start_codon:yes stop_codon:yes gene_type:complete
MDVDAILDADGNIYRTILPGYGVSFTYRLLSLREYKVFHNLRSGGFVPPFTIAETVFERCYLGNYNLVTRDLPAGITISIGNLVMYLSGDCDSETLIDDIDTMRVIYPKDTVFEYMRAAILTVFPYTLEDMENWDRVTLLKNFTVAENVLTKQRPEYERLNLKDIKPQEDMTPRASGHDIDFRKENAQVRKAMGPVILEEAEAGKLSKGQLRKLSAASRR